MRINIIPPIERKHEPMLTNTNTNIIMAAARASVVSDQNVDLISCAVMKSPKLHIRIIQKFSLKSELISVMITSEIQRKIGW
jgi:hypothetical protein